MVQKSNGVKPRKDLQAAFDKWIAGLPRVLDWEDAEEPYQDAVKALEVFGEIPSQEAHSLLLEFKPKTNGQTKAGLFISACYAHSQEQEIVFDIDASKIELIGYKTSKNIFNKGKVNDWFAFGSSGFVINNGKVGDRFAYKSSGIVINNGDDWNCGEGFAQNSSGLAVNNTKIFDLFACGSSGIAINNGECGAGFADNSSGIAINNGRTNGGAAEKSSGVAINNREIFCTPSEYGGNGFASNSSGIAINNGDCREGVSKGWFAFDASGIVVAVKESRLTAEEEERAIKPADCEKISGFKNYLDELENLSKSIKDEASARRFIERYCVGGKKIVVEIKEILQRGFFKERKLPER